MRHIASLALISSFFCIAINEKSKAEDFIITAGEMTVKFRNGSSSGQGRVDAPSSSGSTVAGNNASNGGFLENYQCDRTTLPNHVVEAITGLN